MRKHLAVLLTFLLLACFLAGSPALGAAEKEYYNQVVSVRAQRLGLDYEYPDPVQAEQTKKTVVLETLDGTHKITISGAMIYEVVYYEVFPTTQGGACERYPIGAKITLPSGQVYNVSYEMERLPDGSYLNRCFSPPDSTEEKYNRTTFRIISMKDMKGKTSPRKGAKP